MSAARDIKGDSQVQIARANFEEVLRDTTVSVLAGSDAHERYVEHIEDFITQSLSELIDSLASDFADYRQWQDDERVGAEVERAA